MRRAPAVEDSQEVVELVYLVRVNLDDLLKDVPLQRGVVNAAAPPAKLDTVNDKVVMFCAHAFWHRCKKVDVLYHWGCEGVVSCREARCPALARLVRGRAAE